MTNQTKGVCTVFFMSSAFCLRYYSFKPVNGAKNFSLDLTGRWSDALIRPFLACKPHLPLGRHTWPEDMKMGWVNTKKSPKFAAPSNKQTMFCAALQCRYVYQMSRFKFHVLSPCQMFFESVISCTQFGAFIFDDDLCATFEAWSWSEWLRMRYDP